MLCFHLKMQNKSKSQCRHKVCLEYCAVNTQDMHSSTAMRETMTKCLQPLWHKSHTVQCNAVLCCAHHMWYEANQLMKPLHTTMTNAHVPKFWQRCPNVCTHTSGLCSVVQALLSALNLLHVCALLSLLAVFACCLCYNTHSLVQLPYGSRPERKLCL